MLLFNFIQFCSNCLICQSCLMDCSIVVTWICQQFYMDFSYLLHGFFYGCNMDFSKLICQSSYMDLFKLLHGFVKDVFYISLPLLNETKLKFDWDFKVYWSFCFKLKLLNESKYWKPWVPCAFDNFLLIICGMFFVKQNAHFYLVVNPSIDVMACKYNWKEKQDFIIQKGWIDAQKHCQINYLHEKTLSFKILPRYCMASKS